MIRSCFVQSTSKPISQVPVTWSRLFHIRKSLCLAFKPGNGKQENEAGEKGEHKDRVFKQNKHRNTGRLSSSNNTEKVGFYNERESNKFQNQEKFVRNNQEYPMSYNRPARESAEHSRERYRGFKNNENSSSDRDNYRYTNRQNQNFDREPTRVYDERNELDFDRKERRYSRSFGDIEYGSEESRGIKHFNQYRYTNRENSGRKFDRGQTSLYGERDEIDFDRKERRYDKSFGDDEYGREEGRGLKHFNEYKYTNRENGGRKFDRGQTSLYGERDEIDFDRKERRYDKSFGDDEYGREEGRGLKHFNEYKYTNRENGGRKFDRGQTSLYGERDEIDFDRKERRYDKSFGNDEYGSEESRRFKHFNEYRYKDRENSGRNFDRGQKSFYGERDEIDFDRKERRYDKSFGNDEYGSEESRGFKHFNEYRYKDRENSGRNFDRGQKSFYGERDEIDFDRLENSSSFRVSEHGNEESRGFKHFIQNRYRPTEKENSGRNFERVQTSFYDRRGEQSFYRQERQYVELSVRKDLPKSDRQDLKGRAFDSFLPDFAESESDIEAKVMEDSQVKEQLQGELPQDWSETFGTLSSLSETDPKLESVLSGDQNQISRTSPAVTDTVYDEGVEINEEEKPHIRLSRTNRRHIPHWYARRIMRFGEEGLVKEAIEVFDKWMIERDRVKPTHFEFGVLICLLGKAGYTRKAFSLFAQMTKMDLVPDSHILTSLFNACAKAPLRKDGLRKAHKLRMTMIIQGHEPHLITYGSMINAFGVCGDTEMALSLVDEALQRHRPSLNFLNCALIACVSDKEAGFRHAIQIWRKFIKRGVKPDITSYNILLRAVNECGVGPLTMENTLLLTEAESEFQDKKRKQTKVVSSLQYIADPKKYSSGGIVEVVEGVTANSNMSSSPVGKPIANFEVENGLDSNTGGLEVEKGQQIVNVSDWLEYGLIKQSAVQSSDVVAPRAKPETMLDILNPFDPRLQFVYLGWIQSSQHRLALLGGMKGTLSNIEKYHASPDIVTFTQLLMSTSDIEEKEIWDMMALYDVQPDQDFFNHLILKKERKGEYRSALEVPALMKERNLVPNLNTYGCLARACLTLKDAMNLLQSMENANMSPNYVIMHTLIKKSRDNFGYKKYLLEKFESLDLEPRADMIERIEHHISLARNALVKHEQGKEVSYPHDYEQFPTIFKEFMKFYNSWLERTTVQKKEPMWKEYTENIEEPVIDTDEVIEEKMNELKERQQGYIEGKHGSFTVAKPFKNIRRFKKSQDFATKLVDQRNHRQDELTVRRGLQMNQISYEPDY